MVASRALVTLCLLACSCGGALGFRPQARTIGGSRWTGDHDVVCETSSGKTSASAALWPSSSRSTRRAARGLTMQQTDEEARRTKLRLRQRKVVNSQVQVRIFLFSSFVLSATVGLLVAGTRTIALTQGIDQGQSMTELLTNIVVDVTAMAVFVGLVKRDLDAQEGRMARMEIGAKLAGLKVRLQTKDDLSTVTLSALRRDRGRDKRVAVLVGGAETVKSSLESALPYGKALETSDILIVPLVLESRSGTTGGGADMFRASGAESDLESAVGSAHVALPVALNRWQEYIDSEVETALSQGIDPLKEGFSLVVKKNGRIGARSKGCPPWGTLVGDVVRRKEAGMDTTNI
ncbi:unnamed protein product [Ectocarpus sp. CCAP 1310/34]|nr:unnamed protein product [Ectocarpus sp. CCAP 1310/34]